MSCYVDLIYHPIFQATQLTINHHEFVRVGSRMQKIVIGRPMDQWLEPVIHSYLQWNGFLTELVSETNEISFEIVFEGDSEDYYRFSEAVHRQAAALSESGFDPIEMELTFRERFSVKQLMDQMRSLRKRWSVLIPTQHLILRRDRLDECLEEELTMDQIITLIEDYVDLIHQIQLQHDIPEADQQKLVKMREEWESMLYRGVKG